LSTNSGSVESLKVSTRSRLQAEGAPNAADTRGRDAAVMRHSAGAPVGSPLRLALQRLDNDALDLGIVDAKAQFRSLAEPWADSPSSTGRLMLAVLRGLADVGARPDPHPHRRRPEPRQGPRKAYGPPPFPHPGTTEKEAVSRRGQGATLDELARSYNVSRATISRLTA
jgi:hypothetical protein